MANTPVIISRTVIQRDNATVASNVVFSGPLNPVNGGGSPFTGIGIRINGQIIGGAKRFIEAQERLDIPSYWEYNVFALDVEGEIDIDANGMINIMDIERITST